MTNHMLEALDASPSLSAIASRLDVLKAKVEADNPGGDPAAVINTMMVLSIGLEIDAVREELRKVREELQALRSRGSDHMQDPPSGSQ